MHEYALIDPLLCCAMSQCQSVCCVHTFVCNNISSVQEILLLSYTIRSRKKDYRLIALTPAKNEFRVLSKIDNHHRTRELIFKCWQKDGYTITTANLQSIGKSIS